MQVLIIPGEELNNQNRLSSIFEIHQAQALRSKSVKVGFISFSMNRSVFQIGKKAILSGRFKHFIESFRNVVKFEEIEGLPLVEVQSNYKIPSFLGLGEEEKIKAGLDAFTAYVKAHGNPDIIHAHSRFLISGRVALQIYRKFKIPFIITEHSTFFANDQVSRREYRKTRDVINNSKCWVVVSSQLGRLVSSKMSKRHLHLNKVFQTIPNVLDPELEDVQCKKHLRSSPFVFVSIGTLDEKKNHKLLLHAFAETLKNNPDCNLKIGGDGILSKQLEQLSKDLNIAGNVEFLGLLNRQQLVREIQKSHCFVLPSNIETFGVVLIESLALGRPVIASKCGGPESIVNPSNGLLFDTGNERELVRSMQKMIHNIDSYVPENLKSNCICRYGSNEFASKISKVYKEIISAHNKNSTE